MASRRAVSVISEGSSAFSRLMFSDNRLHEARAPDDDDVATAADKEVDASDDADDDDDATDAARSLFCLFCARLSLFRHCEETCVPFEDLNLGCLGRDFAAPEPPAPFR